MNLFKQEVNYLGHVISAHGVKPDPEKMRAIRELSPPENVRDVRSLLGVCGFYKNVVQNFSKIAKPLTELTKKNRSFI